MLESIRFAWNTAFTIMTARKGLVETEELLTFEEFSEMEFDEVVELEEGKIIYMANNNPNHSKVLTKLAARFFSHVESGNCGEVFVGDVNFIVKRDPDTCRGIDLAFLSHERLADQPENAGALQVAPELAVEIMSPSNAWDSVMQKVEEYFEAGVLEVWVVSLSVKKVTVFTDPDESKIISLAKNGVLKGTGALEGFDLSLDDLFAGLPGEIPA